MKERLAVILVVLSVGLVGCVKNDVSDPAQGQGEVRMLLTDAPAAFDQVNIVVSKVEVHQAGTDSANGWIVVNSTKQTYDLLKLRNGASSVLGSAKLAVGRYTQIRLLIDSGSYVVLNGIQYALEIPSGIQTGAKLTHEFVIEDGKVYEVMLDFNAETSIRLMANNTYRLTPTIRTIATVISGSVSGTVLPVAAKARAWTVSGTDTVSTLADTTNGSFKLTALLAGTYQLHIASSSGSYRDTTIAGVLVASQVNTNIGTVTLSSK